MQGINIIIYIEVFKQKKDPKNVEPKTWYKIYSIFKSV